MPTSSHRKTPGAPAGDSGLPPVPYARVDHVQLVRREVREYVPRASLELLFRTAEVVFEGDVEAAGAVAQPPAVAGSLMITIDLSELARIVREPPDAATAERLAELLPRTEGFVARLAELAAAEIAARCGRTIPAAWVDLVPVVRTEGNRILVDADVSLSDPERS